MIAFLYPGQGAQHAGMIANLPDSAATRKTLGEAAELLPIGELDTAEALASTTNAQLALLICGVATARTLTDEHGVSPDIVAGHSVGAFAAAVGAGVLMFSEAVAAVRLRGDSMAKACAPGQWGMAALTGLRLRAARDVVGSAAAGDSLWIANINAIDQVVLGGSVAALDDARQAARRAGAPVRGARCRRRIARAAATRYRTCDGTASFDHPAPRAAGRVHDQRRRPQDSRRSGCSA
jgi:malonate decarboxylase epsilon subunit